MADPKRLPRILIAGTSAAIDNFTRALAPDALLIPAHSVHEALQLSEQDIDAVLCNVRFDESRMFEFLQGLNLKTRERRIPVICVRLYRAFSPSTLVAVTEALEVVGVTRFVDLYDLREREGLEAALARLREVVLDEVVEAK
jgi:response regulator RpfG family c-di-GMP phosphodiesterase